jgi:hypothetical protein
MAGTDRLDVFVTRKYKDGKEEKTYFTKVGAMWPHKKGDGFNIILEALPITGELVCFPPKEKEDKQEEKSSKRESRKTRDDDDD